MEGILSRTIKASRCLHDNSLPLRTISSNTASVFITFLTVLPSCFRTEAANLMNSSICYPDLIYYLYGID